MIRNILLATDGHNTNAIDIVIEFATIYRAVLHIVSVVDITLIPRNRVAKEKLYEGLKKTAEMAIEQVVRKISETKIEIIKVIPEGIPAVEILNYAIKNKIDIIFIGTSQKKGFKKFLVGSITEDVLRKSTIPVCIVPS